MPITFNTFKEYVRAQGAQLPRGGAIQLDTNEGGTFRLSTSDKRWAVSRSIDDKQANNDIRTLFLKEVAAELGVSTTELSRLPKAVLDALNLDDYALDAQGNANSGKPLTAYRMQQVMDAIGRSGSALSAIKQENRAKEVRAELFGGKDPAEFLEEIPEEMRQFYQPVMGDVKTQSEVRRAAGILNKSRLAGLNASLHTLTSAMIQDLVRRTGVDFSAQENALVDTMTEKLGKKHSGISTEKILTVDELLLDFKRTLGELLNAKADMLAFLQANDANLSPEAKQTLTNAVMTDLSFKSPDAMRAILENLDFYDPSYDLRQEPEVTDEMLLQCFQQRQARLDAFSRQLNAFGLDMQDSGTVDVLLEKVCKQNYLHNHHLEALPPPSQQLIDVGQHFASALGALAERDSHAVADDSQGRNFTTRFVTTEAYIGFGTALPFLAELGIEAEYEIGSRGIPFNEPVPMPEMTKAEEKYFNEVYGLGIRHDALDGEHYKQVASAEMMEKFNAELQKCVDNGEKKTSEIGKDIWNTTGKDLVRPVVGMTLNNRVLIRDYDSMESNDENINHYAEEVHAFFMEDQIHGLQASRILSEMLHQGMQGMLSASMQEQGEIYHGCAMSNSFVALNFQVTRQEDGSYDVTFKTTSSPKQLATVSSGVVDLQGDSFESCMLKLKLSFGENGKARLSVTQKPVLEGSVRKLPLTSAQISRLKSLTLSDGTMAVELLRTVQLEPTLLDNQQFKTLLAGNDDNALTAFLEAHVIRSKEIRFLKLAGIPDRLVDVLRSNVGGQPLDRVLVERLLGSAEERQAALQQLQEMLQVLVQKGFIAEAPVLSLQPLALVTVAGISGKGGTVATSDAGLLLAHLKQTGRTALLDDLQSEDQTRIDSAKTQLKAMLPAARKAYGTKLLNMRHAIVAKYTAELPGRLGQAHFDEMMEHVYAEDDQMQAVLETFRQEAKAIVREQKAAMQQQHLQNAN